MNIEQVLAMNEYQIFDRKSIHIAPTSLSDLLCAFANADGGTVAIGISDKTKRIEGVDSHLSKVNDLLRVFPESEDGRISKRLRLCERVWRRC